MYKVYWGESMGTQFNKITFSDWQVAAKAALRGKNLDNLTHFTADDIAIQPLYSGSLNRNQVPLPHGAWQINQAVNHPHINQAKSQITEDLEQGVNALSLYSNQSINAQGYGLNLNQVNLKSLFENTYLDMISLRLESGLDEISLAELTLSHSNKHQQLSLGVNPVGKLAQFGGWNGQDNAKSSVQTALQNFQATHILRADGRIAHNAGASEAQELGFILNTALTYLKWADEASLDLNIAAQKIEICLSVDQNQFINIAKIRAMRHLWTELLDGLGIKQSPAYIYAETSFRMVTKRDPMVNILRSTMACFSAGIGGANQIGILPLSAAIGLAPSFDRRITRHIQTILIEESHLADVTDPSAGSGYIESLTQDLINTTWEYFQTIERSDGMIANLKNGNIQKNITNSAQQRKPVIIGSSVYINEQEPKYETLNIKKTAIKTQNFKINIEPLVAKRDAEIYETQAGGA